MKLLKSWFYHSFLLLFFTHALLGTAFSVPEELLESLKDAAKSSEEKVREKSLWKLYKINNSDPETLEALLDLSKTQGNFERAKGFVKELQAIGVLSASDAERALNELNEKIDSGEDVTIWESRFDRFKWKEDWESALVEIKKLVRKSQARVEDAKDRHVLHEVEDQRLEESGMNPSHRGSDSTELKNIRYKQTEMRNYQEAMEEIYKKWQEKNFPKH